jgi:hypothetical protein
MATKRVRLEVFKTRDGERDVLRVDSSDPICSVAIARCTADELEDLRDAIGEALPLLRAAKPPATPTATQK